MHAPLKPLKFGSTLAIPVVLLGSLAACGGDDDTPSGSSTATFGGVTVVVGTGSPDGGDDSAYGDPVPFEEVG